jgi:phosphatidylethanolamine/phosphatidyl-N-methylethanolamine N-methyltransferase
MKGEIAERGPEFWRRHARRYDRATLWLNRQFGRMTALVAEDLKHRGRVLEIAAGTGLVTIHVAPVVQRLVATDRSSEMLLILRERMASRRLANVELQEVDAMSLPFADASFDAAVAANILHLLADPAAALSEVRRVLRAGPVLSVPTFEHGAHTLARLTSRVLGLAGFPVVTRFRGDMLRTLVTDAGFSVSREVTIPGTLPLRYICAARSG